MDTLSFSFLTDADDSLDTAQMQFSRREFGQALDTIARMPPLLSRRGDVLELKARTLQSMDKHLDAVAAWEDLLDVDPENKVARVQLSLSYAKLGVEEVFREVLAKFRTRKFADALALLDGGPAQWRNLPEFHRLKATMHERLGQHELALASWRKLDEISPGHAQACLQIPVCQSALGQVDEAWQGFRRAVEMHPTSVVAQFNLVFFEVKQKGAPYVPLALLEVERIRASTSNFGEFKSQLDLFRERLLSLHDPELLRRMDREGVLKLAADVAVAGTGETMRSIYEQFEPLGNNCEFGDAQRKHGAEPLALFRWTSIAAENLARLLDDRFEGFDEPQRYRLDIAGEGEYLLKEDVYSTASHTRVKVADVSSAEALLAQLARRQSFLKRKLLESLEEGQKIFVFKANRTLEDELLDLIERKLFALGARKVLFVMPQDEAHRGGSVTFASATRVIGYLSSFMPDTQFAQWDSVVTQAHRHFDGPGADRHAA